MRISYKGTETDLVGDIVPLPKPLIAKMLEVEAELAAWRKSQPKWFDDLELDSRLAVVNLQNAIDDLITCKVINT